MISFSHQISFPHVRQGKKWKNYNFIEIEKTPFPIGAEEGGGLLKFDLLHNS